MGPQSCHRYNYEEANTNLCLKQNVSKFNSRVGHVLRNPSQNNSDMTKSIRVHSNISPSQRFEAQKLTELLIIVNLCEGLLCYQSCGYQQGGVSIKYLTETISANLVPFGSSLLLVRGPVLCGHC